MLSVSYAEKADKSFWFSLDRHMWEETYEAKIKEKTCYILREGDLPVGIMRYGLFWDNTPFLNLLYLQGAFRGRGLGRQAMAHWEDEMQAAGFRMVMTSTQADEGAQHFYRKLGYRDAGSLILSGEPLEIIMIKEL